MRVKRYILCWNATCQTVRVRSGDGETSLDTFGGGVGRGDLQDFHYRLHHLDDDDNGVGRRREREKKKK